MNLAYINPADIHFEEWSSHSDGDRLLVQNAGEVLYKPVQ